MTTEVSERELQLLVKDWRQGRATKSLWDAIQDAYVVVLAVAVFGAMIITLILDAQGNAASCIDASCISARTVLPFAVVAAVISLAAGASALFGPVLASAAEGFWLLDAPINRSRILRRRLVAAIVLAGVVGAAAGALVAALTGSNSTLVVAWAVATALPAAGVVAFAAAEQGAERTWTTRLASQVFTLLSVAALVLVVGIAAGWFGVTVTNDRELLITGVVAALGLAILILAGILGFHRLNQIRRARLVAGGALVSGMAGAMYALDLGLARDIVVERQAVERGHVKSRPGKGIGQGALIRRDLQRLLRTPSVFLPLLGSLVVPYAAMALGFANFTPMISGLALFGALVPLMGTLRVLTRSLGLARCLPFSDSEIRKASIVIPAVSAGIWGVLSVPAYWLLGESTLTDAIPLALITALAGVLGAVRWVAAKPVDYGAPMLATQAGAMPPGLLTNMIRGFDMVLLITIPVVFGLPWIVSLVLAAIVYWFVTGNFNMDALREQQEQQKAELEKARATAKKQKQG